MPLMVTRERQHISSDTPNSPDSLRVGDSSQVPGTVGEPEESIFRILLCVPFEEFWNGDGARLDECARRAIARGHLLISQQVFGRESRTRDQPGRFYTGAACLVIHDIGV